MDIRNKIVSSLIVSHNIQGLLYYSFRHIYSARDQPIQQWMQTLPALLLSCQDLGQHRQTAAQAVVLLMAALAPQAHSAFIQALQSKLDDILGESYSHLVVRLAVANPAY